MVYRYDCGEVITAMVTPMEKSGAIDYDGVEKSYWNYDMPETGPKIRVSSTFKNIYLGRKYLHVRCQQVSNLQISCSKANVVVPTLVALGRKGIDGTGAKGSCVVASGA